MVKKEREYESYHAFIKRKYAEDREKYELDTNRRDPVGNDIELEREKLREFCREYLKKV